MADARIQKKAAEKKEAEAAKKAVVQVDDLLSFRQFSKKAADDIIDVCFRTLHPSHLVDDVMQESEDVGRATGAGEVHEDFISNLNRISQLTGASVHDWLRLAF